MLYTGKETMPDYANGKIYKIVGEDGSTYYGSTTESLKDRMRRHRCCKTTTAYQKIISQMKYEIILIENYPCESKEELLDREATYIRGNPCVNQCIPRRTMKEWREVHREDTKVYNKIYGESHREEKRAHSKKHYEENREQKLEYGKIRYYWRCSFGDPRYTNCIQRCDPSLFQ